MTAHTTLGALLLDRRKARGLTQAEAAKLASVSEWTWTRVETGKPLPSAGLVARMCSQLAIEPGDLEKLGLDAAADRLRTMRETADDQPLTSGAQFEAAIYQAWMAFAQLGFTVTLRRKEPGVFVLELRDESAATLASRMPRDTRKGASRHSA